jgi:hypothetical protein
MALAPVHPEAAGAASQEGPKQIRPRRVVGSGPGGLHDVGATELTVPAGPRDSGLTGRTWNARKACAASRFGRDLAMASDSAVTAAWIAATAVAVSAAINAYLAAWGSRRQRETELIVSALTHLVGGSQERSAGLATLRTLRARTGRRAWGEYSSSVERLLHTQLLYVLVHGRNRWQAHEAANVEVMAEWLLSDQTFSLTERDRERLWSAMQRYGDDWRRTDVGESDADSDAVENLLSAMADWKRG